jgi:hypothetical protein
MRPGAARPQVVRRACEGSVIALSRNVNQLRPALLTPGYNFGVAIAAVRSGALTRTTQSIPLIIDCIKMWLAKLTPKDISVLVRQAADEPDKAKADFRPAAQA